MKRRAAARLDVKLNLTNKHFCTRLAPVLAAKFVRKRYRNMNETLGAYTGRSQHVF